MQKVPADKIMDDVQMHKCRLCCACVRSGSNLTATHILDEFNEELYILNVRLDLVVFVQLTQRHGSVLSFLRSAEGDLYGKR